MFEIAEQGNSLDKKTYKNRLPELRTRLLAAQRQLSQYDFPVIILVSGVDGGGKGDVINLLNEWMDPRFIHTITYDTPSDEEQERPKFWRYWRDLPPKGSTGIFVSCWYSDPISQFSLDDIDKAQLQQTLTRINQFEKQQVDEGTLIIKCWLHLSKSIQKQRINKLDKDTETSWKVSALDKKHLDFYDQFINVAETVIKATNTDFAPWLIVEGSDLRYSSLTIGEHILDKITEHLEHRAKTKHISDTNKPTVNSYNLLADLDLTHKLGDQEYQQQISFYQSKIFRLTREARQKKISSILVFEGWDAAGKGGVIRRLAHAADARNYRIIPIAAPTDEERQQHYLWRFWRYLPRAGKITIYDRSWYGRVLVERVENLATIEEWQRAYSEIINFEKALVEHGILLMKFWLHINPDEQLRRFKEREQISYKQHKITAEDYRNRKQWQAYEAAVNDMVAHTSTIEAPWLIVEANDKKYARIKILKAYAEQLEQFID